MLNPRGTGTATRAEKWELSPFRVADVLQNLLQMPCALWAFFIVGGLLWTFATRLQHAKFGKVSTNGHNPTSRATVAQQGFCGLERKTPCNKPSKFAPALQQSSPWCRVIVFCACPMCRPLWAFAKVAPESVTIPPAPSTAPINIPRCLPTAPPIDANDAQSQ